MLMFDALLDKLSRTPHLVEGQKMFLEILRQCYVFQIDNVAKYLYEDNSKEDYPLDSFPNIAPPFECMWFEFTPPSVVNSNGTIKAFPEHFKKIGILSGSRRIEHSEFRGWLNHAQAFIKTDSGIHEYPKRELFAVNDDGTFNRTVFSSGDSKGDPWVTMYRGLQAEKARELDSIKSVSELIPMFLAISFLHCKNVEMIDSPKIGAYTKSTRLEKGVKYYTLKIEPMKKVLRTEGQSETLGLKHALHICRGHFKDYSNGSGLFGKYKGLYWWESTVRGNPANGVVVKDYNVNSPQDGAAVN